jgi:hypothetical protein
VIRESRSAARLATAVVLVGFAVAACGRAAPAQGNQAAATEAPSPVATATPAASATLVPSVSVEATPSQASSEAPSGAAGEGDADPTIDSIDVDLAQLEQLLKGVGGSLSSADAGGE